MSGEAWFLSRLTPSIPSLLQFGKTWHYQPYTCAHSPSRPSSCHLGASKEYLRPSESKRDWVDKLAKTILLLLTSIVNLTGCFDLLDIAEQYELLVSFNLAFSRDFIRSIKNWPFSSCSLSLLCRSLLLLRFSTLVTVIDLNFFCSYAYECLLRTGLGDPTMLWMVAYCESSFLDSFLRWSVTILSLITTELRLLFLLMLLRLRLSELRALRALCLLITSSNESSLSMDGMLDRFYLMPSSILIRSLSNVPMFSITSSTALGILFRTGLNKSWLIYISMSLLASLSIGWFEVSILCRSLNLLPNLHKKWPQKCFKKIQGLTFRQRWCSCCLKAVSWSFLVVM